MLIIFFKNMYYFPKTGILFTLVFLVITAYLHSISGNIELHLTFITSFLFFITCYGVPINIIGYVIAKQRKKRKALENNLGLRLVKEIKGCHRNVIGLPLSEICERLAKEVKELRIMV